MPKLFEIIIVSFVDSKNVFTESLFPKIDFVATLITCVVIFCVESNNQVSFIFAKALMTRFL